MRIDLGVVKLSERPHTLFVSYAHADSAVCDRYVASLRLRGLDVWYDRTNLQEGRFLSTEIEHELRARTAFLVLLSPASVASYWVNLEISAFRSLAARDANRLMLPIRIAECEVPLLMAGIKWVDALPLGFDVTIDVIVRALGVSPSDSWQAGEVNTARRNSEVVIPLEIREPIERVSESVPSWFDGWKSLLTPLPEGYVDYLRLGSKKALVACDRALADNPTDVHAWKSKGAALRNLKRYEEALAAFDRALALEPKNTYAWGQRGDILRALHRDEEALAAYDNALARSSNDGIMWNHKGVVLQSLERHEEALAAFDRVLVIWDPPDAWNLLNKGNALIALGRYDEAMDVVRQARALNPKAADRTTSLGSAVSSLRRCAMALAAYDQELIHDSHNVRAWTNRAAALGRMEYYRAALAASERALAVDPMYAPAWNNKAIALRHLKHVPEALKAYNNAIDLDPTYARAWGNKAILLRGLGLATEAEEVEQRAKELGWPW